MTNNHINDFIKMIIFNQIMKTIMDLIEEFNMLEESRNDYFITNPYEDDNDYDWDDEALHNIYMD